MHGLFGNPEELSQLAYFIKKVWQKLTTSVLHYLTRWIRVKTVADMKKKIKSTN